MAYFRRMLPTLNFPEYPFQLRETGGKTCIFDPVRRRHVVVTPEEWVRQHTLRYLSESLHYPFSHMVVEHPLTLHRLRKRADILVYGPDHKPAVLVECKASHIALTTNVLEQVSRYNIVFKVPWLLVTNGLKHYSVQVDHLNHTTSLAARLPLYDEL